MTTPRRRSTPAAIGTRSTGCCCWRAPGRRAGLGATVVMRPTMIALLAAVTGAAVWPLLRGRVSWGSIAVFVVVALAGVAFYAFDPRGAGAAGGGGDSERMLLNPERFGYLWDRAIHFNLPKLFHPTVAEAVFAVDFSP